MLTELIQEWVCQRYKEAGSVSQQEMMFRPMLRWLDRNAENLMTEALKEVKTEVMQQILLGYFSFEVFDVYYSIT